MENIESFKERLESILDKARPFLREDQGDVEFVAFEEENGTLELRLLGACADCPLSMLTLRAGIERLILSSMPEVKRVEKVT